MIRQIGNKFYAYAPKRIRDPKHPKGYRIIQEYLGCLGSRARQANSKHKQIMAERKEGKVQKKAGNIDLYRYLDAYLKSTVFKAFKKRTQNMERNAINLFKEFLEQYHMVITKVNQATPAVIIDFQNWMLGEKKKSNANTNRLLRVITKLMKEGEKNKEDLTWKDIKKKKEYKGKQNPFQWNEVFLLLQVPDFFWYGVCVVGMLCGLRRSEMRHITTYDVTIEEWEEEVMQEIPEVINGKIFFRKELKKVERIGGELRVCKKIKSKATGITVTHIPKDYEARNIQIPDWAALWLKEAIKRAKYAGTPYIFNVKGKIMTEGYLTSHFKGQAAIPQGVENATPHRLRMTYGTGMGELTGAATLLLTMGHSDLKTTIGYMGRRDQQLAIEKLQKAFEERSSKRL